MHLRALEGAMTHICSQIELQCRAQRLLAKKVICQHIVLERGSHMNFNGLLLEMLACNVFVLSLKCVIWHGEIHRVSARIHHRL